MYHVLCISILRELACFLNSSRLTGSKVEMNTLDSPALLCVLQPNWPQALRWINVWPILDLSETSKDFTASSKKADLELIPQHHWWLAVNIVNSDQCQSSRVLIFWDIAIVSYPCSQTCWKRFVSDMHPLYLSSRSIRCGDQNISKPFKATLNSHILGDEHPFIYKSSSIHIIVYIDTI